MGKINGFFPSSSGVTGLSGYRMAEAYLKEDINDELRMMNDEKKTTLIFKKALEKKFACKGKIIFSMLDNNHTFGSNRTNEASSSFITHHS